MGRYHAAMAHADAPRGYRCTLGPDDDGRRLDRVLRARLGIPHGACMKRLRRGDVYLDGRRVRQAEARVAAGQRLEVRAVEPREPGAPTSQPDAAARAALAPRVVYRDEHMLVFDKPAGEVVHAGSGHAAGLVDRLVAAFGGERPGFRPALAHRLDRDTSGLIVLGRSGPGLRGLAEGIRERLVIKVYRAIVRGIPDPVAGEVSLALLRDGGAGGRMVALAGGGAVEGAKPARTRYRIEGGLRGAPGPLALLRLGLVTGRRHQARAHMAAIGHPIGGDVRYGDPLWNEVLAREGVRRLLLHASELELPHPVTGERMRFSSPLPEVMARLVG